ncbi:ricin-type beta-trefoil lectin domain protein [Microbispora cellulosiformans]|uniref:Ricin-type beta-trefoil lectin domain protein n=1 Tax=Microbispora cellulosiformans TaxID=2614688 RepID=A0A5J5K5T6_9ACTN|nr:ricin-type beta-trefoil lectin domain protein [Microbispora cellulosiformans]
MSVGRKGSSKLSRTTRRTVIALATAVTSAVLAVGAYTIPAFAATSYLFHNSQTNACLDSNSNSAYTNPCNPNNNFQRYYYATGNYGYLIRSVATNYCIDSNGSGNAYTNPCSAGNAYQNWQRVNWSGSTFELQDIATGRCLETDGTGAVFTNSCNVGNNAQRWWN